MNKFGNDIWTAAFWRAIAERAVSTGAQAAVLAWGGGSLPDVSLPWWTVPGAFLGGAGLAVLKGVAVNQATGDGPGLTKAEVVDDNAA